MGGNTNAANMGSSWWGRARGDDAGGALLRRTLWVSGALLGASALWITLLSVISVLIADRLVISPRDPGVAAAAIPSEVATSSTGAPARPTKKSDGSKPNG